MLRPLLLLFAGSLLALAETPGERLAAYGRVSAGERAVIVAVPSFQGAPELVGSLAVKIGDHVQAGQPLARTASWSVAEADVAIAQAREATVAARLTALKAGARPEEIAAQEALVQSLAADLRAAKAKKRPDTTAGKDELAAQEEALKWKVTAGQQQLAALRTARPADLEIAAAEAAEAAAATRRAEALLHAREIVSPLEGQILRVLAYPGEGTAGGLVEVGATQRAVVKAELAVADAVRVRVGAKATLTCEAWPGERSGTVTRLDVRVERSVLSAPSALSKVDRQIIEATVEPLPGEAFSAPVGAPVTVLISPGAAQ